MKKRIVKFPWKFINDGGVYAFHAIIATKEQSAQKKPQS